MADTRDVCIVFADVSGSTTLYEKLGDAEALRTVERCLNAMTRATATNRGRVVKTIGDEIMSVFDSAAQGMQAACEMQQRIDEMPVLASGVKARIRAGLHFGSAIVAVDSGDVFGDTVNTAARMAGMAKAGQIITTADTVAALPGLLQASCREIDAFSVKGKAEHVRVCEVIWQEGEELTMLSARTEILPAASSARLRLRHGADELLLVAGRDSVTLGRDPGCDITIRDAKASRSHARIEHRRDKFVLVDMSSNGTFVKAEGEAEIALKREELILRGAGHIAFGHAWVAGEPTELVRYSVES